MLARSKRLEPYKQIPFNRLFFRLLAQGPLTLDSNNFDSELQREAYLFGAVPVSDRSRRFCTSKRQ